MYGKTVEKSKSCTNKSKIGNKINDDAPGFIQNFKHYAWEFCSRTTMHGFNYLGEKGRTISERILWLITIVVSLYICTSLILQTYQKWVSCPVIVTFEASEIPIWKIPFPAVTICSETKSRKSRFNYTKTYIKKMRGDYLTETEAKEFEFMSMVCETPKKFLNQTLTEIDEEALDFLVEAAPNFNETMFQVSWRGREYKDMAELFSPILMNEGLCYTFNAADESEIFTDSVENYKNTFSSQGKQSQWLVESGYADNADMDAYPRRTAVQGMEGGLRIIFKVSAEDLDYACTNSMQGFKVLLHHPMIVPRGRNKYFRVALDTSVNVAVYPNIMTTSDDLRNYQPEHRQCYFLNERSLKHFKIYNQPNCLIECLTNFTLETCGCVGFYMQRENSTPICSASKLYCLNDARVSFLENEVTDQLRQSNKAFSTKCKCLPSCNSIKYSVETSSAEFDLKASLEIERQGRSDWKTKNDHMFNGYHFSRLTMYFDDLQFIASKRSELYGQINFWASCGGLLGLFTGFSFISAMEIVYYLTLRLICNVYMFGRHHWSGSKEIRKEKNKSGET